jgi:hypothetical protein
MAINEEIYLSRQDLVEMLGETIAQAVIDKYGGGRLYIPSTRSAALVGAIGEHGACVLSGSLGGMRASITTGRRSYKQRITDLRAEGLTPQQIRGRIGCSLRYVRMVLAQRPRGMCNPDLKEAL